MGRAARDDLAQAELELLPRLLEIARLDVVAELAGETPGEVMDRAAGGQPATAEQ